MTKTDVAGLVDHLFRANYGQMVARLTGLFGPARLGLAEDVMQEAMIRALKQWPFNGIPEHPRAWLIQVARNLALDILRREQNFEQKRAHLEGLVQEMIEMPGDASYPSELQDDQLCLMFTCCHPAVPVESRLALTLKTACGFGVGEIARAFLLKEATVAQRLVRARRRIRQQQIPFALPDPQGLAPRLRSVLDVLYIMFNEGHTSSQADSLIRDDICAEAIRLTRMLADHPVTGGPETHALAALMLFQAARFASRQDGQGDLILLEDQDRSSWDSKLIGLGLQHLQRAGKGDNLTDFHLEAEIAAYHTTAKDFATTNWAHILILYDLLWKHKPGAVIGLNRAVALAQLKGPAVALEALDELQVELSDYYPFYVTLGSFWLRLGQQQKASAHFHRALELCDNPVVRRYLLDQL